MLSDIALIVTAIGVVGVVLGLRQNYRERLRQFEAMYVQRYWMILDKLSIDALSGSCPDEVTEGDNKAIRSYFFLCEDELEMRENGYVADSTYKLWRGGIRNQLKQPMFEKIWKQITLEAVQHHTFPYVHLTRLLNDKDFRDYDPLELKIPSWRRRLRGLAGLSGV